MCPQRHQCLHTATIEQLEGLVKLSGRSCLACDRQAKIAPLRFVDLMMR